MANVELVSIESVVWPPDLPGYGHPEACWKVTLGVPQSPVGHVLITTYYFDKRSWTADALAPVAKSYFHNLCRGLADETKDWNLGEEQIKALRRPQTKPQSSNPA